MKFLRAAVIGATLFGLSACATSAPGTVGMIGKYDFRYRVLHGDELVAQVFDDGAATYIQIRLAGVPTVFDGTGSRPVKVATHADSSGQYWVVDRLTQHLSVVVDQQRADVDYDGEKARGTAEVFGMAKAIDVKATQAFEEPASGDLTVSVGNRPMPRKQSDDSVVPASTRASYRNQSNREGSTLVSSPSTDNVSQEAAISALVKSGALSSEEAANFKADIARKSAEREAEAKKAKQEEAQAKAAAAKKLLEEKAAAAQAEKLQQAKDAEETERKERCKWTIAESDRTASAVLSRWGTVAGYGKVFVEVGEDPMVEANGTVCADSINEAAEQFLSAFGPAAPVAVFHTGNHVIQLVAGNQ